MLMVAPELLDHITQELHTEAAILKEKRKFREERQSSRGGPGAKGEQDRAMQGKLDKAAAKIKELESKLAGEGGGKGKDSKE